MPSSKKGIVDLETIKSFKVLELTYMDGNGKRTVRKVEPMTLFQKGFAWYLFGYCLGKKSFRIFKMSRIKEFRTLNQTFVRKQGNFRNLFEKWRPREKKIEMV